MLRRPGGLVGPRGNALRRTLLVGRGVGLRKLSGGLGGSRGPGFAGAMAPLFAFSVTHFHSGIASPRSTLGVSFRCSGLEFKEADTSPTARVHD